MASEAHDAAVPLQSRAEERALRHDEVSAPVPALAEEEDESDFEEVAYGADHLSAVMRPVMLTMALACVAVANIRDPAQDAALSQGLSLYLVYDEPSGGGSGGEPTGALIGQAAINAIVIVCVIAAATFMLVLCYKYRCLKLMVAYLIFACANLLGYSGGFMAMSAIQLYRVIIDWPTLAFIMYNFAITGVVAVFYQKGVPRAVTQGYLIAVSVIMAWLLSKLPEWTAWALLLALAVYDLCAVLTPCGPLKALIKLASERRDPIPGLLYEANVGGGEPDTVNGAPRDTFITQHGTGGGGSGNARGGAGAATAVRVKSVQGRGAAEAQGEGAVGTVGAGRAPVVVSVEDEGFAGATARAPLISHEHAAAKVKVSSNPAYGAGAGAGAGGAVKTASDGSVVTLPPSHNRALTHPTGNGSAIGAGGVAASSAAPVLHGHGHGSRGHVVSPVHSVNSSSKAKAKGVEDWPATTAGSSGADERDGATLSSLGTPASGGDVPLAIAAADGGAGAGVGVGGGDAAAWAAQQADEEEDRSIKLGLGDFVFYSVLVSRAALFDASTMAACFVAVVMGLGGTLFLLGVYRKALPALPISIFLGVIFYLVTRLAVTPMVDEIITHLPQVGQEL